jgi:hypothetical protein
MAKQNHIENSTPKKEKCITIHNRDIEKIILFKYMGSNTTKNNNISSAVNHRIRTGTTAIMDCEIYWVSKLLRKGAKCNIN